MRRAIRFLCLSVAALAAGCADPTADGESEFNPRQRGGFHGGSYVPYKPKGYAEHCRRERDLAEAAWQKRLAEAERERREADAKAKVILHTINAPGGTTFVWDERSLTVKPEGGEPVTVPLDDAIAMAQKLIAEKGKVP